MTYKIDEALAMLDEILMRLDRLERALIKGESVIFTETNKKDKPRLSVVKTVENNIVEFDPNGA